MINVNAARRHGSNERLARGWIAVAPISIPTPGSLLYIAHIAEHFVRHLTAGHAIVGSEQSFEFVRYPHALDAAMPLTRFTNSTANRSA
jgi:hypothetical protein